MYLARHPAALVLDALFESARILRGSITCLRQFEGTGSDPFLECAIRLAQLAGQCRAGASFAQAAAQAPADISNAAPAAADQVRTRARQRSIRS
jgi:hypothetical protein